MSINCKTYVQGTEYAGCVGNQFYLTVNVNFEQMMSFQLGYQVSRMNVFLQIK